MDYENTDWAATALFSPSKARQQQALAKDWSFIDSWLTKKYSPKPVPKFERNDETLQALLGLAAFNEKADEEQELIERLEEAALKELEQEVDNEVCVCYCFFISYETSVCSVRLSITPAVNFSCFAFFTCHRYMDGGNIAFAMYRSPKDILTHIFEGPSKFSE